jgi:hypothetical protein
MVLGNATLYTLVDDSDRAHERLGSMPNCRSIQTVLQLSSCVSSTSSKSTALPQLILSRFPKLILICLGDIVLAAPHHIPLLWTPVFRSCLPCLLPSTILAITGRVLRKVTRALLVAPPLRNCVFNLPLATSVDAILRTSALLYTSIYLVEAEPRHKTELPRVVGLHRSILAVGVDGIQLSSPWHGSQG